MPRVTETASALFTVAMMTGVRGKLARLVVRAAGPSPGDRVVDVGCGPGTAVRRAARAGAEAAGVDPAQMMLWLARKSTPERVSWHQGTAESLPFDDGWATVVWSIAAVHHWQDRAAGLAEVFRVLSPGGRVLLIERLIKPDATGLAAHGLTGEAGDELVGLMSAAGLADARKERRHAAGRDLTLFHARRPA